MRSNASTLLMKNGYQFSPTTSQPHRYPPLPHPLLGLLHRVFTIVKNARGQHRIGANGLPMGPGWDVYSHGGRKNVGLDAVAWATQMAAYGAGEILLTSMDRDGTKSGFDLPLTRAVSDAVSVPVIASGGVGNLDHLADGVSIGGADAVLAASIFHYGEYTVQQAKARMRERGIPVRL